MSGPVGPGSARSSGPTGPSRTFAANGPAGPSSPELSLRQSMWQLREELTEEDVVRIWREVLVGEVMDE